MSKTASAHNDPRTKTPVSMKNQQTPLPLEDGENSNTPSPTMGDGHSNTSTPTKVNILSNTSTPTKDKIHSNSSTPTKGVRHSNTRSTTPTKDERHSNTSTPTKDGRHSNPSTPTKDVKHSNTSTPTKGGRHSNSSTPTNDGRHTSSDLEDDEIVAIESKSLKRDKSVDSQYKGSKIHDVEDEKGDDPDIDGIDDKVADSRAHHELDDNDDEEGSVRGESVSEYGDAHKADTADVLDVEDMKKKHSSKGNDSYRKHV